VFVSTAWSAALFDANACTVQLLTFAPTPSAYARNAVEDATRLSVTLLANPQAYALSAVLVDVSAA
jgi:hypothetical protein